MRFQCQGNAFAKQQRSRDGSFFVSNLLIDICDLGVSRRKALSDNYLGTKCELLLPRRMSTSFRSLASIAIFGRRKVLLQRSPLFCPLPLPSLSRSPCHDRRVTLAFCRFGIGYERSLLNIVSSHFKFLFLISCHNPYRVDSADRLTVRLSDA